MFGKALTVIGMKIDASINGGVSVPMAQVSPVVVTCVMDGARVVRVYADEGVEFVSEGGFLGLQYKAGMDITEICNRADLARQIKAQDDDNDEMHAHTKGK